MTGTGPKTDLCNTGRLTPEKEADLTARLLSIRPAGAPVLTAEEVAELDPGMPQQAIVAAYRKFSK